MEQRDTRSQVATIRQLRLEKGYSARSIAQRVGLTPTQYFNIENHVSIKALEQFGVAIRHVLEELPIVPDHQRPSKVEKAGAEISKIPCLGCDKLFISVSKFNRICKLCKGKKEV